MISKTKISKYIKMTIVFNFGFDNVKKIVDLCGFTKPEKRKISNKEKQLYKWSWVIQCREITIDFHLKKYTKPNKSGWKI